MLSKYMLILSLVLSPWMTFSIFSVKIYDCLNDGIHEMLVQKFTAKGCQVKIPQAMSLPLVVRNLNLNHIHHNNQPRPPQPHRRQPLILPSLPPDPLDRSINRAISLLEQQKFTTTAPPVADDVDIFETSDFCYWPIESHLGWLGVNYNLTMLPNTNSVLMQTMVVIESANNMSEEDEVASLNSLNSDKLLKRTKPNHKQPKSAPTYSSPPSPPPSSSSLVLKTFTPIVNHALPGQQIKHEDMFVLVAAKLKFEWNQMVNIKHVIHDGHSHQPVACFQYRAFIFLEDECNKQTIKNLIKHSGNKLAKLSRLVTELRAQRNPLTMLLEQKILSLTMIRSQMKKAYNQRQPCWMYFHLKRLYKRTKHHDLPRIITLSEQVAINQTQEPIIEFSERFIDDLVKENRRRQMTIERTISLQSQIKTLQYQLDRLKRMDGRTLQAQIAVECIFNVIENIEQRHNYHQP